jgi:hypothetical protein
VLPFPRQEGPRLIADLRRPNLRRSYSPKNEDDGRLKNALSKSSAGEPAQLQDVYHTRRSFAILFGRETLLAASK